MKIFEIPTFQGPLLSIEMYYLKGMVRCKMTAEKISSHMFLFSNYK